VLTLADVQVSPMHIVDMNEFTLVCFWIEWQQFNVRQKFEAQRKVQKLYWCSEKRKSDAF
jgi:hypothetical protein